MQQTHRHDLHMAVPHPLRRQHAPCWPRRFGTPDRRLKAHRSHHCVCVSQTAVVLLHMSTLSDCLHQGLQEKAGAATGAGCLKAPQLQPGYSCTLPPLVAPSPHPLSTVNAQKQRVCSRSSPNTVRLARQAPLQHARQQWPGQQLASRVGWVCQ
jgi:hypothetical protein